MKRRESSGGNPGSKGNGGKPTGENIVNRFLRELVIRTRRRWCVVGGVFHFRRMLGDDGVGEVTWDCGVVMREPGNRNPNVDYIPPWFWEETRF